MQDVKTDISLISEVAKQILPLLRAEDQTIVANLGKIPDENVSFVYNYYKNNAQEGNFKALRFIVADMLKKGENLDLHTISSLKQKFCKHDTSFFSKNYPELVKLVQRCDSRQHYAFPGNLFKQLHPLFWYTKKEEVERAFRRICYYIDTHIDGFSSYEKHIITFDGIQGSPQADIYCSWYPKHKLSYNRSYQLFIRIKHNGVSAGVWKGNSLSESFENQEIECGNDIERVLEVLQESKSLADNLNSGKGTAQQQVLKEIERESEGLKQMPIVQHEVTKSLNTILYGCPGTGKTYNTIVKAIEILSPEIIEWAEDGYNVKNYAKISEKFNEYVNKGRVRFITFHQSYSYEEFIEGIKPEIAWGSSAKDIKYVGKDGIFKEFCNRARQDTNNAYVLIIDEINRGNISKIFGELITLIEEDKRETLSTVLPYSQQEFTVPKNLYIIGTMNTADRSILSIDIALRRRFSFIEQEPEENLISFKYNGFSLGSFVAQLNKQISVLIDKDHQLGHSEFMKVDSVTKLREVWFTKTLPLLNEYLYGDWEKLTALVPNFINKAQVTDAIIKDLSGEFYYWFKKNSDFASDDDFINALTM